MIDFKNKKIIGISIMLGIVIIMSLLTYGKNKNKVFKDEYMENIFVEEEKFVINDDGIEKQNSIEEPINKIIVEIKGEVNKPDVYELDEGSIIKDLIDVADGLTEDADISKVNRARELINHELIVIKNINDIDITENSNDLYYIDNNLLEDDGLISINTSDISKLKEIQGIGDVKAQAIINYREKNGDFKVIDELKNVDGIGEKTFEKIKEMIKL